MATLIECSRQAQQYIVRKGNLHSLVDLDDALTEVVTMVKWTTEGILSKHVLGAIHAEFME
jgi:hypothetical protein